MIVPSGILTILGVALTARVANGLPPQKLFGGDVAAPGEFPYQVALRVGDRHHCGGAIISDRHVLTAAHCVAGVSPKSLRIATGTIAITGGRLHSVSKIVPHPRSNAKDSNFPNDIAIITLAAPITFNDYQKKIDLATGPTPEGALAVATGWGVNNEIIPLPTATLLKAQLRTIGGINCQYFLDTISIIHTNQICTLSFPGVGTCQGDSGGPLAYNGKLIGLVSYGIPCAQGAPDVFTSVFHHRDWINQNIKAK